MKRRILFLMMFLLALVCVSCGNPTETPEGSGKTSIFSRPVVEKPANGRKDWNDVSSFCCYYGPFDVEFQSNFDVVIMHSSTMFGMDKEEAKRIVKQLQDAGCYIVSYHRGQ